MNLLVDTAAFIFWATRPDALTTRAYEAITSGENTLFLSVVSPWEMQVKVVLKKLELHQPPLPLVRTELSDGAFLLLPITLDHIDALGRLPHHHKDPFDRMLIAQAMSENLTIITSDAMIAMYEVPTLW